MSKTSDQRKQNKANTVMVTGYKNSGVLNDSGTAASVTFPAPWTSRVQTPVKRVPFSALYATPDGYQPTTYGGPIHG
jgi:hypothetical protein